jgi:SAM-dependent methyltransferase
VTTDLKKYSSEGIHEKVLGCLEAFPRGFVLDVPSGQGAISKELEKLGFKVFLGDIARQNILYKNWRCVQIDMEKPFPFKEKTFDYGVCVEGIEHIENPYGLVREFARVIKKGGYLIITTPNVMTIKSRLRFLFYSYLDYFRYIGPIPSEERHRIEEHEHHHLNPLFYPEIKFILQKCGFAIERIETNRMVKRWKLLFPLIKWFTKHKTRKKYPKDPFYISDMILEGEDLIVIAKKSDGRND